jgi:hypothetical protein
MRFRFSLVMEKSGCSRWVLGRLRSGTVGVD